MDGIIIREREGKMAEGRFQFQHQFVAFIKNDSDISIKRKTKAVLTFENCAVLGTLDYFDVHGTKVGGKELEINCTFPEIFCREYDCFLVRSTPC